MTYLLLNLQHSGNVADGGCLEFLEAGLVNELELLLDCGREFVKFLLTLIDSVQELKGGKENAITNGGGLKVTSLHVCLIRILLRRL